MNEQISIPEEWYRNEDVEIDTLRINVECYEKNGYVTITDLTGDSVTLYLPESCTTYEDAVRRGAMIVQAMREAMEP